MDFFNALQTSSSGLSAQRLRMNLISANFPVLYNDHEIGIFNITATLDGVYERLQKKVFLQ